MKQNDPITDEEVIAVANQIKPGAGLTPYVENPHYEVRYNGVTLLVNRGNKHFRSRAAALSSLRAFWVLRQEITNRLHAMRENEVNANYFRDHYEANINKVIDYMLKQGIITIELV